MPLSETIVSLSTPEGQSAIAMIRLSGPLCLNLATEICNKTIQARKAYYTDYKSVEGIILDKVICIFYNQSSFTGEYMLEFCCHGNPLICELVIKDLIQRGCRLAEPGEFTRTAFLNGKMDLSQAEAVADLIHANSQASIKIANKQLSGGLSDKINTCIDTLLTIIAHLEAYIDFPEEDLPAENTQGPLYELNQLFIELTELIHTQKYKNIVSKGIQVAIVGAPNAGKSTLLNGLLGQERSLVSPVAGTTRDYIRENTQIGTYSIHFIDTAGLRTTQDSIEQKGIDKTIEKMREADFFIWVVDGSDYFPNLDETWLSFLHPQKTLLIENKADLASVDSFDLKLKDYKHLKVSLLNKDALESIRQAIIQIIKNNHIMPEADSLVVNARHAQALSTCLVYLEQAIEKLKSKQFIELAVSELRLALDSLGEILGKVDNEAMLDKLFASFCIGK